MEMLAVVGFFIVCASICVSVFAGADRLSRKADDLNHAVLAAQSLMEELKSGKREEELPVILSLILLYRPSLIPLICIIG